jgi:3-methyladenine DNA glycosylase AlkD
VDEQLEPDADHRRAGGSSVPVGGYVPDFGVRMAARDRVDDVTDGAVDLAPPPEVGSPPHPERPVDVDAIVAMLESKANPRGIAAWTREGYPGRSVGLGLTELKKLAKKLPKDHDLARALWATDLFEARILACQLGEASKATCDEVEAAIEGCRGVWLLSHAWCTGWLPGVPFVDDLIAAWIDHDDPLRRRCAWLLVCTRARRDAHDDAWCLDKLDRVGRELQGEENFVRDAMNTALLTLGQRSATCWARALEVARAIGKVSVDYGKNSCEAVDVVKHLDGPRIRATFAP